MYLTVSTEFRLLDLYFAKLWTSIMEYHLIECNAYYLYICNFKCIELEPAKYNRTALGLLLYCYKINLYFDHVWCDFMLRVKSRLIKNKD